MHFIKFVLVETNQHFGSNSDVVLTLQNCGHRASRVAGRKRRALAFYFSVQIWYVFSISKCRGESDLILRMSSVLANRMPLPLRSADFRRIVTQRPNTFGDVKAIEEFVLTYYSSTPLPSIKLKEEIRQIRRKSSKIGRQSSRSCANLVLQGKRRRITRGVEEERVGGTEVGGIDAWRETSHSVSGMKRDRVRVGMMEATHLNTTQHTATYWNTLQHTL